MIRMITLDLVLFSFFNTLMILLYTNDNSKANYTTIIRIIIKERKNNDLGYMIFILWLSLLLN
jgi:hypothetical protein